MIICKLYDFEVSLGDLVLSYLPNPSAREDMTQGRFFLKRSLTGLNSEFSFS